MKMWKKEKGILKRYTQYELPKNVREGYKAVYNE